MSRADVLAARREETDRKILRAALQVAMSRGVGAVTIEEIARVSGVAKTTIYRRYRNTEDLLQHVRSWRFDEEEMPYFAPTRDGFQAMMAHVVGHFEHGIGVKAVGLVLASEGGVFRSVVDQVVMPARKRFADYLARGVEAGALRQGLNVDFLFSTVLGSMVAAETLHGAVPAGWPAAMAALIWPAIAADA